MKKINILNKILLISILAISSSCTSKLGNFTVISSQNVRGLEYKGVNRDELQPVKADSCTHRIYLTRTALGIITFGVAWFMPPFDIVLGESEKERLETAVDNAIKEGKRGVFDGDMIANAVVKEKNIIIPLIYGYKCIIVEGDVVSSVTRKKS